MRLGRHDLHVVSRHAGRIYSGLYHGADVKRPRIAIVVVLVALVLGFGLAYRSLSSNGSASEVTAQHDHSSSTDGQEIVHMSLWSDPRTWGGKVPRAGSNVTIPHGMAVVLDESPPPLKTLKVYGALIFARRDLSLTLDAVELYGLLEVGTPEEPFAQRAEIHFTGTRNEDGSPGTPKGISVLGGRLDLHGDRLEPSWTRLAETVDIGDERITLEQPVMWRPGQRIVISSTELDTDQAEELTIARVDGNIVW